MRTARAVKFGETTGTISRRRALPAALGALLVLMCLPGCGPREKETADAVEIGAGMIRLKHKAAVAAVAFSADGKVLATGGPYPENSTIHLWDPKTGKRISGIKGNQNGIKSLAYSPAGGVLASAGGDATLRMWAGNRGGWPTFIHGYFPDAITNLSFSADGKLLAMGSSDTFHVWDVASGKELHRTSVDEWEVASVALRPDGKLLAVGIRIIRGPVRMGGTTEHRIILQELAQNGERVVLKGDKIGADSMAFSPDGKVLATGGHDNTIRLRNASSGKKIREIPCGKTRVYRDRPIEFSPDGKLLASTSGTDDDKVIYLWEVEAGQRRMVLKGHRSVVLSLAFSPDGKRLASGGADGVAIIWDLEHLPLPGDRIGVTP